jgi:outer membrane protein assembly factor BamB
MMEDEGVVVFKLSGATGSVLWRYVHTPDDAYAGYVQSFALDGSGSLYVAADVDSRYTLDKLSAATGTLMWRRKFPKGLYSWIAFDPAGDLVMGGHQGVSFTIQKVRAVDGRKRWRRKLRGNNYNGGYASQVAWTAPAPSSPPARTSRRSPRDP